MSSCSSAAPQIMAMSSARRTTSSSSRSRRKVSERSCTRPRASRRRPSTGTRARLWVVIGSSWRAATRSRRPSRPRRRGNQISGAPPCDVVPSLRLRDGVELPRHRRDDVPITASARWKCSHWLTSTQVRGARGRPRHQPHVLHGPRLRAAYRKGHRALGGALLRGTGAVPAARRARGPPRLS